MKGLVSRDWPGCIWGSFMFLVMSVQGHSLVNLFLVMQSKDFDVNLLFMISLMLGSPSVQ